ncbi:RGS1-HXK1-interacting protein 1 isoform X1 [Hordeum vulgare subsp. vulgare]|uniref:RGS1-HXK1-interacting protein 1 isoform X1 n=1 Tax=Hordeum vulgare subsp. vulgare TaxID=112509 RepID=UPI001D1A50FB|nr:RGS1-HXK1-interacting protein 1 isoform X1 [Hordeum vulgare subsp. vulgare]
MASSDTGRTPAQGAEAASASSWPLRKLQSFTPGLWSQYKAYEDVFVERAKVTISDAVVLASEHQVEAIGCATVAGFILFRGPRRFLYRNTLGRFKTEKDLLNDVEQSMIEYKTSIESLRKDSKYTLDKVVIGESDLQRGRTDLRSTGKQIQSVISSIYKAESTAAGIEFFFKGLMDRLRIIPTRQSLELRAEVASMASDLKNQRHVLEERVNRISEYGVRV